MVKVTVVEGTAEEVLQVMPDLANTLRGEGQDAVRVIVDQRRRTEDVARVTPTSDADWKLQYPALMTWLGLFSNPTFAPQVGTLLDILFHEGYVPVVTKKKGVPEADKGTAAEWHDYVRMTVPGYRACPAYVYPRVGKVNIRLDEDAITQKHADIIQARGVNEDDKHKIAGNLRDTEAVHVVHGLIGQARRRIESAA